MRFKLILSGALVAVATLSGCQWNDLERAGAGAAGGALIAGATRGNVLTGAVLGAGVGALCDDVNIQLCQ